MTDKPTITQADRDAASEYRQLFYDHQRSAAEQGYPDLSKAFAKHRESSVAALKAEAERLREALQMAAKQFRFYEENHQLKGTSDGEAKAETNRRCAEQCEAALAPKEPVK